MSEICELSATQLVANIKNKTLSSVEIAQAFTRKIEQINPLINAIHQVDNERILDQALKADKAISAGNTSGKLYGLPVTIKDALEVKGFTCSKGFPGFLNGPSTFNATVVQRLINEGAIVLGITNVPELLLSYESDNLIYGRTNNPHDVKRTPGGSSGGEAAIIASGGSPAGIGTDAGGSIRQPAHYSGICGHKPTQGLVPSTGKIPTDATGLPSQILCVGPMARHVEDLTLLMQIIAGVDSHDPYSMPVPFGNPDTVDIKNLRIAYFYDNGSANASEDTVKVISDVIRMLKSEVSSIHEAYPEPIRNIYQLHWETFMLGGDGGALLKKLYARFNQKEVSPLAQQFLQRAEQCHFSALELRQHFIAIDQFRYDMMHFMDDYDVILSPVAATPARVHGETPSHLEDFNYVTVHNLTGWPATVVPCGKSTEGLPVGIQIAARPWQDHVCLALAKKIQTLTGVFPVVDIIK